MINNEIVEKIICIASAVFLIGLFTILNDDLKLNEAFFVIFIIVLILSRHSKKKELKALTTKYKDNQQLLSEIFKYCPDIILLKNCDFEYIACNDAKLKLLGLKLDEIINKTDFDIFPEETAKSVRITDNLVLKNKETLNYYQDILLPSNERIFFNIVKSPFIQNGKVVGILGIARDVTVQRHLQNILEGKKSQLSIILENMPFYAYVKDLEGKVVICNKKFAGLFEKTVDEIIGLTSFEIFCPEVAQRVTVHDKTIIENRTSLKIEEHADTKQGLMWLEINKTPIINENNEVTGIVVIIKDIEEVKMLENQKETFVATLTHDLKIPTIAQIKALELILRGSLGAVGEEKREALEQVLNSCKYMFNMISTLLSTYKYDNGVKAMNYEKFNFVDLMTECCNEIASIAKEKSQKLNVKNNSTNEMIFADKLEIKRVIMNFISNAIFYSFENSEIEVKMENSDEELLFTVINSSKVIPEEELVKIFDKYVSNAAKYKQIGVGLGLYLSKQIITAHHGEVIAESDEINGNTFGFRLPQQALINEVFQECVNLSGEDLAKVPE